MTRIVWDTVGERTFETGLDHGVLYVDNAGYVWNGLISIDEDVSGTDNVPIFIDGLKVRDIPMIGDFEATIRAYTYPDEFLPCEGVQFIDGVLVDGQRPKPFSLSYRTLVGNDIEGIDHGYKIHIAYNLTATPDTRTYETLSLSDSPPTEFTWNITGVPESARPFYRPTAHIVFDTRLLFPEWVAQIEAILYGSKTTAPRLPTIEEFFDLVRTWA